MADKYEQFIASYLRLNAYFTITNFIVHAADDPKRVSADRVGNYTEADILGIRMPCSFERTGPLHIANHQSLVGGIDKKHDVVIAEVKSGTGNCPNTPWKTGKPEPVASYIVRFIGLHDSEAQVNAVATCLCSGYRFEDDRCRFRYVVFSHNQNDHYANLGVTYITFQEVIVFLVAERGKSWLNCNLGVASTHSQWDEVLNKVFEIANDHKFSVDERVQLIQKYLAT